MHWRLSLPSSIKNKKSQTHAFRKHGTRKPPKSACDVTKNVHSTKTGGYNKDAQKKLTTIKVAHDEKGLWLRKVASRDIRNAGFQNEGPHDGIVSPREEVSVIVVFYIP